MLEGVLKGARGINAARIVHVSILGMLEGVLKDELDLRKKISQPCFNPWYVGGGVKRGISSLLFFSVPLFQSLVCWRGC